ncbi:3-oxoacyl-synthase [Lindgomyces ingoldianus]|uniref:3-oxoacyl-synthase n=1 Tax=Lindgomyces ingoldianus TaxID=673940 RepID=A0ACB6R0A2_9PLEO|nr:3-oxoacyl-synthase [Lindgomyces ingoldianus]KAF2472678.1 3-oxoacyl-synthase [Lindgomyces ingoldianus]
MHPEIENDISYALLLELLAYQFAMPVRWIETQQVLFGQENIDRLIEIGPTNTLAAMAKKTLASQYSIADAVRSRKREVLCHQTDAAKIFEETNNAVTEVVLPKATEMPTAEKSASKGAVPSQSQQPDAPVAAPRQTIVPAAPMLEIPDVPISAGDILTAIISSKLKKPCHEINGAHTIKTLTGGRSTLENELIGDLGAEFPTSLPDRSEDIPLADLSVTLQSPDSSTLGKVSSSLLAHFFAARMPPGYTQKRARAHMQTMWNLPPGHQSMVLLRAASYSSGGGQQQQKRLVSDSEAQALFDDTVRKYFAERGLDFVVVDAAHRDQKQGGSSDNNNVQHVQQLHHNEDGQTAANGNRDGKSGRNAEQATALHLMRAERDALGAELAALTAELGDAFVGGVRPVFSARKVRRFTSSWNWAVQDLFEAVQGKASRGGGADVEAYVDDSATAVAARCEMIARRGDERLEKIVDFLVSKTKDDKATMEILEKVRELMREARVEGVSALPFAGACLRDTKPRTLVDQRGKFVFEEAPRTEEDVSLPRVQLKERTSAQQWQTDDNLSNIFDHVLHETCHSCPSFKEKTVLLTGAGTRSIGFELLKLLLTAGARVVVTTSHYSPSALRAYRDAYTQHGASGSELVVVPFNQGSQQDIESLVSFIFDASDGGLGWDVDHIVPFAAVPEAGHEVDGIDAKSELAHRIMLVNVVRLLGVVKKHKESRRVLCRPAQVLLPLSPNHGAFGGDGLYAESKIGLEPLFDKWYSETWAPYLTLCGASIGWTRGTGLMAGNDTLAGGIEALGVRTFTQCEIATLLLVLINAPLAQECEDRPIFADLTGGLDAVPNLKETLRSIRGVLDSERSLKEAMVREAEDEKGYETASDPLPVLRPQPNLRLPFPSLPDWDKDIEPLHKDLNGMVDLDSVVVITGFAELGPWGNARTRWEMESQGELSIEGCIEMAWLMGLIKNHDGPLDGQEYHGWVDTKTGKPVHPADMKDRYERHILENSGIRFLPEEPGKGHSLIQEMVIEEDLPPLSVPRDIAEQLRREHGHKIDVYDEDEGGSEEVLVQFRKGASLLVPKALGAVRRVAGQLPQGWDPRTYGIPEDIVSQVDPVTLYTLISTCEALLGAGITDPFELYKYIHLSEIGNMLGSGLGGVSSLKKMFLDRKMDKPVQSDVMAESFINTTPAWVNMLLLSSSGPIRTSVGACATSIESLETGVETIVSGKAKMCLVGGFDDLTDEVSAEFANMRATVDAENEVEKGRIPAEMSRPTTTTRNGFVESAGSGVQVITSARLALDMGLPIYGIVALASTASDSISRSVPAPGKGILTTAAEAPSRYPSPLLDIHYRCRRLALRKREIENSANLEIDMMNQELNSSSIDAAEAERLRERKDYIAHEAQQLTRAAQRIFGNAFWQQGQSNISPLRGALAVWGLTVDDIGVVSLHGTSTRLNDINEPQVLQAQLTHLGRAPGNVVPAVCQKSLTGHSKGAAGAWMLNGALQMLNSGLIPGNRNIDDVDAALRHDAALLTFPNRTLCRAAINAFSVTSFGFGQKGAQAVGVHARFLFATLTQAEFEAYARRVTERKNTAQSFFSRAVATNALFVAKTSAPYLKKQTERILLDPSARAVGNGLNGHEYFYEDDLVDRLA